MISIWEQASFLSYDVIIVGAGITGLSTAASLKEKSPNLSILVLEKGILPSGASTRNAGFACFGSLSELIRDREIMGEDRMRELVEQRWKGLAKTRKRLGDEVIGYDSCGGFELVRGNDTGFTEELESINYLLKEIIGNEVFKIKNSLINSFGFEQVQQVVYNPYEGALHTGKLMNSLWNYCASLGVRIFTGVEANEILKEKEGFTIKTKSLDFHGQALALCTNAFSKNLIKENIDLVPGRGLVTLVKPEKPLKFKGTFHYNEGYFYFRDFEDKLIFGGGRNLDFESETTTEFGVNKRILQQIKTDLDHVILPGQEYEIEMTWSGIMAFGTTKEPIVKRTEDGYYLAIRLGGMGIAIGSMVGDALSDLILQDHF